MQSRTATVIALSALIMMTGCNSLSRETKTVYKPVEVVKVVDRYVPLPEDLLKPCPVVHAKNRKVKEYVRVANTNTPALEQCAYQIYEIRKLQPKVD